MIHKVLGVLVIVVGIVWLFLASFAGMMHTVPQNPSVGEILTGVVVIVVGLAIIFIPKRWW